MKPKMRSINLHNFAHWIQFATPCTLDMASQIQKSFKIQNEHLTGKLEEYHSMQKKLSDFRQEVQDLEDGRKKLEIELDQKKNIDGALDYLKESNSKAANKIYHQEE